MSANNDPMINAVDDVTSVAEELRALRQRIKQYGDASKRLADINATLDELSGSISKMPTALSGVIDKANSVQTQIEKSVQSVEILIDSVPDIVKRIEASDVTSTVQEFSGSIQNLGTLIESHQKILTNVIMNIAKERESQLSMLGEIDKRTENIISAIGSMASDVRTLHQASSQQLQQLNILNSATVQDMAPKLNNANASVIELKNMIETVILREIATIRSDVANIKPSIDQQNALSVTQIKMMELISKKKWSLF